MAACWPPRDKRIDEDVVVVVGAEVEDKLHAVVVVVEQIQIDKKTAPSLFHKGYLA